ncbi:MAG: alpha/beta hydrolase [Emcibacter sp.]|nr:alpha/beta hydrolase [Emcibacter sp.]
MSKSTNNVTISGDKLEIKRYQGNDNRPTLIFLHEGLGCVDMWRDFPEKLSQMTGCSALVYSRQGYGRSDSCPLSRPVRYMHDEALDVLPELLTATGIEDHILIGHSDGGSIALIHAGAEDRTGLLGLITMAPHVFCEDVSVSSIAEAKKVFLEGNLRASLEKYHHENTDCAFWGWNDIWLHPDFLKWNIEEYLPRIKIPQLVLQGADDQYGTVAQVQSIAKQSGGSVVVQMLADCGHSPYKEQETLSLNAMKNFILPLIS